MDLQKIIILALELVGTVAFAASGSMVGMKRNMDVFGVCVLGVVTSVGGGMVRDVILDRMPGVFQEPVYVTVAVATSCMVFAVMYFKRDAGKGVSKLLYERGLLIMDSVGLAIFTVMGVITGIQAGYGGNTFLLVFLGTITGVGGGLLRDMMAGVPPYIFVRHVYACASIVGALSCVWIYRNLGEVPAIIIASGLVLLIRYLAAHYRWNLPHLK